MSISVEEIREIANALISLIAIILAIWAKKGNGNAGKTLRH